MAWCLTKAHQNKFKKALKDGTIDPFKMANMSSEQRRAVFETITDTENAIRINSLYESKLLLKNRLQGFKTWVKRTVGLKPAVRRDMLSKIERLNELDVLDPKTLDSFKADLARTRLGFAISFEQAKNISDMGQTVSESKKEWVDIVNAHPTWSTESDSARKERWVNPKGLEYGLKVRALENYVNEIKQTARKEKLSFKEDPLRATLNVIRDSPTFLNNLGKSLMATLDNSLWGRQGIKQLLGSIEQKKIWGRNFIKSFGDIKSELLAENIDGFEPMDLVMAEIYSRPNSLNGKYKAGDYQLGVAHEEAIPTSLPERIPVVGRVFKAAETAFSAGALRSRADLADMYISKMEAQGLNTLDSAQARGAGHLVGSLTGRGSLGKLTPLAKELNLFFWSARFLKSNIDTLTAHQFDPQATPFTKTEARKNLVNIVTQVGGLMMLANILNPDLVDEDPRSTNFGKIKVNGKWTDITGGMGALVRLVSRTMIPTKHNGEWGLWKKASTGKWTNLVAGQYGQDDAFDLIIDGLFTNKLSPLASIVRDAMRGEMFGGEPFDIRKSIVNSVTPISIQTVNDVKDEKFSVVLGVMISEFFGLGTSTYKYAAHWSPKDSEELKQFYVKVGKDTFKDANESYNRAYDQWLLEVQDTKEYKEMSDDSKNKLRTSAKAALKDKIFMEYGFKKKKTVKTLQEIKEEVARKQLKP